MMRVLVGADGSGSSERAVELAARMAAEQNAELWIVNIVDHLRLTGTQIDALSEGEHATRQELLSSLSAQLLEQAKACAEARGVKNVRLEQRSGDPASELVEVGREIGASLLVVGKRGCSTLAGLVVGSVSHKLIAVSPVPVMVVP